jgi:hypothetical protein
MNCLHSVSSRKSRESYKGERKELGESTNAASLRSSVWFVGNPYLSGLGVGSPSLGDRRDM